MFLQRTTFCFFIKFSSETKNKKLEIHIKNSQNFAPKIAFFPDFPRALHMSANNSCFPENPKVPIRGGGVNKGGGLW